VAFLQSFGMYLAKLVFYVILAVCGIFAGKKLRDNKNAKTAAQNPDTKLNE
jgi:hypothetical protein